MRRFARAVLLSGLYAFITGCSEADLPDDGGQEGRSGPVIVNSSSMAAPGEIILKLKTDAVPASKSGMSADRSGIDQIDNVLGAIGTVRFERLFPECGRFEERTRAEGLHRWYIAEYDPEVPVAQVADLLSLCKDVEVIEYSLHPKLCGYSRSGSVSGNIPDVSASVSSGRTIPFPFNESGRTRTLQWHYNNTGTIGPVSSLVGADADVYAAWQLCKGNPDVIVAVIDEGVKYDHEDLADNMWVNGDEIPGNGIDDDGNGYVDDIYGYNFIENSGTITSSAEHMHGTHVAGTIAAVNNNGTGVNGIAGGSGNNDGVRIMSLQCISDSGSSSGSGLGGPVRAMKYAADNGAVICQNSWGYTAGAVEELEWKRGSYSALAEAMRYFIKYAGMDENGNQEGPMAGGIILFAAGNDGSDELAYPAADPAVVSVASFSYLGTPASYTNYGTWVSMAAPGGDLTLNTVYGGVYSTSVAEDGSSYYESLQGTSMACPHVSGACALAVSYYYGAEKRKGLTGEDLRQALLSSTRHVDNWYPGSYSGQMGVGVLDTYNLLLTVTGMKQVPPQHLSAGQTLTLDLGEYFPSVQVLVYTVSDPDIAGVSLEAGVMTIEGKRPGTAVITVTDGTAIRRTIDVTVE